MLPLHHKEMILLNPVSMLIRNCRLSQKEAFCLGFEVLGPVSPFEEHSKNIIKIGGRAFFITRTKWNTGI
jgi:hypothetical protein